MIGVVTDLLLGPADRRCLPPCEGRDILARPQLTLPPLQWMDLPYPDATVVQPLMSMLC
jgi:hypothetical protein